MSRIAKKPIILPEKTTLTVADNRMTVKGPLGELSRPVHRTISIEADGSSILVTTKKTDLQTKALWGTHASHLKNMIEGVTKGYEVKLEIEGVGFRWEVAGNSIKLALGFSHPVVMEIPQGITAKAEKSTLILSGIDKEAVTQFAANIRSLKRPEPYKGKGIHYAGEVIRRKQGKKTA